VPNFSEKKALRQLFSLAYLSHTKEIDKQNSVPREAGERIVIQVPLKDYPE